MGGLLFNPRIALGRSSYRRDTALIGVIRPAVRSPMKARFKAAHFACPLAHARRQKPLRRARSKLPCSALSLDRLLPAHALATVLRASTAGPTACSNPPAVA